jgi:hypothetical protein
MKRLFTLLVVCSLGGCFALAQESNPQALLKEFTRSVKLEGYTISFVLLNEKTVDALFQAPGKYAIRARASQATTFYVQGVPEKDTLIDTKFSAEQDGETIAGNAMNIKNFDGNTVTKGTRFDGLLQLDKKLDVSHPFKIKGAHGSVEFKLSEEALKLMTPTPVP